MGDVADLRGPLGVLLVRRVLPPARVRPAGVLDVAVEVEEDRHRVLRLEPLRHQRDGAVAGRLGGHLGALGVEPCVGVAPRRQLQGEAVDQPDRPLVGVPEVPLLPGVLPPGAVPLHPHPLDQLRDGGVPCRGLQLEEADADGERPRRPGERRDRSAAGHRPVRERASGIPIPSYAALRMGNGMGLGLPDRASLVRRPGYRRAQVAPTPPSPGSTLPTLGPPHHTLGMVAEFTVT